MMAAVFYALFISSFGLVKSDLITYLKGTNEKCCRDRFFGVDKTLCQEALEKQLLGSYVEEEYKKKSGNPEARRISYTIIIACNDTNEKFSKLKVTPEQYGFLIAACSTYNDKARKSFLQYLVDHEDKLEKALKLNANYFQLLYDYDDKYVDKMIGDSNFAETLFNDKFQEYFYNMRKKMLPKNASKRHWWHSFNLSTKTQRF